MANIYYIRQSPEGLLGRYLVSAIVISSSISNAGLLLSSYLDSNNGGDNDDPIAFNPAFWAIDRLGHGAVDKSGHSAILCVQSDYKKYEVE